MTPSTPSDPTADLPSHMLLQQEWQALTAKHQSRRQLIEVEHDTTRADLLAHAETGGLSHRTIAASVGISKSYVTYLLRYHRYLDYSLSVAKVQEYRFRGYWKQACDPHAPKRGRSIDPDYEQQIFATIAAWIDADKPLRKPQKPLKPKTAPMIHRAVDPLKALQKEVRRLYQQEMKPTLDTLQRLLHADRSTYAPTSLADYSVLLNRSMQQLLNLFADHTEQEKP